MRTLFAIVAVLAIVSRASAQEFGDAPDGIPACQADVTCNDPTVYPTVPGTPNAALGRDAPVHFPPVLPIFDFYLGGPPTIETSPLLACCDWGSAAAPGDCDSDDGALVLSLGPTPALAGALVSGIFAGPDIDCTEQISACFGPSPINAVTGECWGVWYVEATTGVAAPAIPHLLNVVADWNLDGHFGDALLEWAMIDKPLAGPGVSGIHISEPFPVLTVGPDPLAPMGWAAAPFWTRAMVSVEPLLAVFPAFNWDGSGLAGGYLGGETEDWVVLCDPTASFTDCNHNLRPDAIDVWIGTSRDQNRDGIPDECQYGRVRRQPPPTTTVRRAL